MRGGAAREVLFAVPAGLGLLAVPILNKPVPLAAARLLCAVCWSQAALGGTIQTLFAGLFE